MSINPSRPFVSPVLIGRARLVGILTDELTQAWAGHGRVILLAGDAGIGKSRLAREACTLALQKGCTVQQGACFEADRSLPYAPLLDLLRLRLTTDGIGSLGAFAPDLAGLLPELGSPEPAVVSLDTEFAKRRRFQTLTSVLTSPPTPGLILVEDLHWCDDTSLEFLTALARAIRSRPVALLLTFRPADVEGQPSLRHFLAELNRNRLASELALKPLALDETAALIRAVLDLSGPLRQEFLEAIYALTDGNPFFIEEILRALADSGDIHFVNETWARKPLETLRLPRSIQDAVQRRIDRLGPATRDVLNLAAVAGRRFEFDLLQALTHSDEGELLEHIKRLIEAQLVVEESADRFSFRHGLTRQAVYTALLSRERLQLHRSIALTMERLYADRGQRFPEVGDLSYQFFEAGVWDKAMLYSQQAARQARQAGAPRAAIEHVSRALRAAGEMRLTPPGDLYHERGLAREVIGDFEGARADLEIALTAAQAAGDTRWEWRVSIDLGGLWTSRDYERAGIHLRRALAIARESNDLATLAHSLNRVGNWHVNVEQPREGLRYHQEALTVFETLHDEPGLAETHDLAGMACYLGADCVQGSAYYTRAIALFRKAGNRAGLSSSLATLTMRAATYQTDLTRCPTVATAALIDEQAEALKAAREIGWRPGEAYALFLPSFGLGARGDYARALVLAKNGLDIAEEIGHRQWMAAARCSLGAIHLDLMSSQDALSWLEPALDLAMETGSQHWIRTVSGFLALACLQRNDLDRTRRILKRTDSDPAQAVTLGERLLWYGRAELALAEGQAGAALRIVDTLETSQAPGVTIMRLAWIRGRICAARQDYKGASAAFDSALEIANAQGALPMRWRILAAAGLAHQAQGRQEQAFSAMAEASATITQLAAQIPDNAVAERFRENAFALLPGSQPGSSKQTPGRLTAREREVTSLIAQGQSNRAIAETLVLSERTVEGHVSNILGKLSLESRAQIAVWAVEHGLGAQSHKP